MASSRCTCPTWDNPDDFDGPEDYAASYDPRCPEHGEPNS